METAVRRSGQEMELQVKAVAQEVVLGVALGVAVALAVEAILVAPVEPITEMAAVLVAEEAPVAVALAELEQVQVPAKTADLVAMSKAREMIT